MPTDNPSVPQAEVGPEVSSAPAIGPEYKDGKLTRKGMEQVHVDRGSVLHKGRLYMPGQALPDEAELALGDEQSEAVARDNLLRQQAAIDEQLRKLGAGRSAPRTAATTPTVPTSPSEPAASGPAPAPGPTAPEPGGKNPEPGKTTGGSGKGR